MSTVFHFDVNRCTGCEACRLACTIENELPWGTSWRKVSTFNEPRHRSAPRFHLSHACYHCTDAPCQGACPARAIARDESTGAVLIDGGKCIGCGYCVWVCPFDAPVYDEAAGVMTKCTFCRDRLVDGLAPACVSQCPTGALQSGEPDERPGTARVEGFPPHDVGPAARFVPLRAGATGPLTHLVDEAPPAAPSTATRMATLRDEWPLLVFTLVAALLVGWWCGALAGGPAVRPLWFLGAGVAGMGLGALHLGRPARAWRAVLGFGTSWLSREVVLFHAFLGLAALHLLTGAGGSFVAIVAALVGLAALFGVDRIYDAVIERSPVPLHSADTLPTALLFSAVLSGNAAVAVPMLLLIAALYVHRLPGVPGRPSVARILWILVRIGDGLLAPLLLILAGSPFGVASLLAGLAVGTTLDRIELYLAINPSSPSRQMAADLAARQARGGRAASDPAA